MSYNKIILLFLVMWLSATTASCNNGKTQGEGDPMAADSMQKSANDTTPRPMFISCFDNGLLQMAYWTDVEEPQKDDENAEYFEQNHKSWALQQMLRRNAKQYTKLIVDGNKTIDIEYVDEVVVNPDGEKIFPGELHGNPMVPTAAARFRIPGKAAFNAEDLNGSVIVTDEYLANHKLLPIKNAPVDKEGPLPASVIKQMEEKYGMKAERSINAGVIGGRYTYGVMQFKGEYKKAGKKADEHATALALEIIVDGDKVYSIPVEGHYDPQEGPSWNVDDEDKYYASSIQAAFEGPQGPEFYFKRFAVESATTGVLMIRDGELLREDYAIYHLLIDEATPVWKTDLEKMRKLYAADDPENKNVKLTKWARVFIDYNGEQLWLSDKDDQNGAFFSHKDGEYKLIGTVRPNLRPSFPRSTDGNNYLVLSGPAGGPSYFYEVYTFKNGKMVEKFTALEIYGEPDECSRNGKEISIEEGKAFLQQLPKEQKDNAVYWEDIDKK